MSAIVCGKRSFFDDLPISSTSASPPVSKKLRCSSSSSPIRFSPFSHSHTLIDQLSAVFPEMDKKLFERALEECGNDLDSAIRCLHELCLGNAEGDLGSDLESNANMEKELAGTEITDRDTAPTEWVELLVREMMSATSIDDARHRATRVLESLEKSISILAGAEAAQNFHKENVLLREQIKVLLRENTILKRAVGIQHERQKEYDEKNQELQHLKQLVSEYQEQLRNLEVNNYALTMHLQQAQQSNSIPGRFNPDVF